MSSRSKYELDYSGFNFDKYYNIEGQIPPIPMKPYIDPGATDKLQRIEAFANELSTYIRGLVSLKNTVEGYMTEINGELTKITANNKILQNMIKCYKDVEKELIKCSNQANSFCYQFSCAESVLYNAYKNESGSRISSIQASIRRQDFSKFKSNIKNIKSSVGKRENILKNIVEKHNKWNDKFTKALATVIKEKSYLENLMATANSLYL